MAKERLQNKIRLLSIKLTRNERKIATNLVDPSDIKVTWDSVAGLDDVIQELKETVIFPIQKRHLIKDTKLIQPPSGVLLHGPPGCGKTMIAKAMAREAGAWFINLDVATLTSWWYGKSEKLARAVFTLGAKLQPAIIFIDEIDSFLRSRTSGDHETTAMMKAIFLTSWDGLTTDQNNAVVVMGATNRPDDVDKAILRRMPCSFHIGLPIAEDVDVNVIAKLTEGFSGSDLRELCRSAAMYRVKDYLKAEKQKAEEKVAEEMLAEIDGESGTYKNIDNPGCKDQNGDFNGSADVEGDSLQGNTSESKVSQEDSVQDRVAEDDTIQGLRAMAMNDFSAAISKMKSSTIPTASNDEQGSSVMQQKTLDIVELISYLIRERNSTT